MGDQRRFATATLFTRMTSVFIAEEMTLAGIRRKKWGRP